MKAAYCFLRTVEHRLQMVNDEQTQTLPAERAGLERFARFLGFADRDAFAAVLVGHLDKVQGHYARLFEAAPAADRPALNFPPETDDRKTLDRLGALGFKAPLEASAIVRHWLSGGHRPLKGEFARGHLQELVPVLLEQIGRSDNPDAALLRFDHFLANLHAPARLLSLLRQNPELIALIALVLGTAPRLGDTVARYPQVMDALVDPSFFGALPDDAELARRLDAALAQSRHDEDLLERIRMFGLEYMFLIGVRILSGTVTARQAGEAFARLADAVIRAVHRAVADNFAASYGHLRGEETAVLAMGKLGGYEMTATSDLDLILVYDFDDEHPESDGKRPLHGTQYFARLTQRLINALTAQTNYGALYQVDMRLRPSGRAGPLATQIEGFIAYQDTEAWTWEHMALTRARVVSASPAFKARVEGVIAEVLRRERDPEAIAGDVVEMRAAIAQEKSDRERWDLKYAAGGLIDIEFIAQYLQLVHAHQWPDILDTSTARVLDKAWALRRAAGGRCRSAAPGGAALPRSHADLAALPAGAVRCQDGRRRAARPAGARRRRAGFRHPRRHADRDASQGARELRADFGQGALGRFFLRQRALRHQRQPHHHQRALAERRADAHAPAVQFDQRLGNRQPEAGALVALGELALDLLERPPEPRQRVLRDADAGIGDRQHDALVGRARAHRDAAAAGRELDRVRQQIERDLLDGAAVGAQLQVGRYAGAERELLVLRARRHHAHGFAEQRVEVEFLEIETDAAGLDLGHVEDVVDDVEQILPAAVDVVAIFADIFRRRAGRTCRTP